MAEGGHISLSQSPDNLDEHLIMSEYESPQSPPKEEHLHTNDESPSREDSPEPKDSKENSELEKYWKAVRENSQDFTGWTYLLQYVEQENDLEAAREAFDAFFNRYPYCYGYWKKYADLEKKNGKIERCHEVFERGVKAVPLSVDLWLHYLNFFKTQHKDDSKADEKIRELFERAIAAAGTEFKSDRLWEMYLTWENENKKLKNVTSIYDRLLSIPTQLYAHHFEKFQEHVNNNLPKEILTIDEFLMLRQDFVNSQKRDDDDVVGGESPPPGVDDEVPPGEEASFMAEKPKLVDEETAALRRKIIEIRRKVYKANEEEVSKRWAFEEGIKRPYFHIKPLERAQLKNWRDYLDFEIENGSHERVIVLFERCMIACALYEDFWTKYAKYLETYSEESARDVYRRACTIHLIKKPFIQLAWAAFEEKLLNYAVAWEILENLEKNVPGYIPVTFRRVNLERRQGNQAEVEELYRHYITTAKTKEMASHYAAKFARYYFKVCGNFDKAVEVLQEALKTDKENPKLYLQLVDCCYQQFPLNETSVLEAFDEAINSDLPVEQKILFSQRKLEFYEDFGSDIQALQDAYEEHGRLMKYLQQDKKKRPLSDDGGSDDASKEKKVKLETNGVETSPVSSSVASTVATNSVQQAADHTAYNYQNWQGYSQNYNYHQPTWNPYSQHYYTGTEEKYY